MRYLSRTLQYKRHRMGRKPKELNDEQRAQVEALAADLEAKNA